MKDQKKTKASEGRISGRPATRLYPCLETNMGPNGKPALRIHFSRNQTKTLILPMECKATKKDWDVDTKRFIGDTFATENLALDAAERLYAENKDALTSFAAVEEINKKMRDIATKVLNGTYNPQPVPEQNGQRKRVGSHRRMNFPGLSVTRKPNGSIVATLTKFGVTRSATLAYIEDPSAWDNKLKRVVGDDNGMVNKRMEAVEKAYTKSFNKVATVKGLESLRNRMLSASEHVARKASMLSTAVPNYIDSKSWYWRTVSECTVTVEEMLKFQFHEDNRAVDQDRVAKVKAKCMKMGMDGMPQLRIEAAHHWILDGQARVMAIKQLYEEGRISPNYRVPVKFMDVSEDHVVECIHAFNAGDTSKWSQNDWVRSYVSQGEESYIRLHNFAASHRLTVDESGRPKYRYACAVIKGVSTPSYIKGGKVEISEAEAVDAEAVYTELETMVDILFGGKASAEFIPMATEWRKVRDCHPFDSCMAQLSSMKARIAKARPATTGDWCAVFDAMNSTLTKKAAKTLKAAE